MIEQQRRQMERKRTISSGRQNATNVAYRRLLKIMDYHQLADDMEQAMNSPVSMKWSFRRQKQA